MLIRGREIKTSYVMALALLGLLSLWILSGYVTRDHGGAATAPATDAELFKVKAEQFLARPYELRIKIRGKSEALRKVELQAQTEGRVVQLPVEKGHRVKAGDLICRLETEQRQAKLDEAKALLRQRELENKAAQELLARGFRSANQAAANQASYDAARAQFEQMQFELAYTRITAPFDGVIETRPAEIGKLLRRGDICATLVDEDPYLVVGEVAENRIGQIHVGQPVSVRLYDGGLVKLRPGESGATLTGRIRFASSVAQPGTGAFRVEAEIDNAQHQLREGLSADIEIAVGQVKAQFLPASLLVMDARGNLGVRAVTADDKVRVYPVTVLGDERTGVWVAGLPAQVWLISEGQSFVGAGQKVHPVRSKPGPAGAGAGA